MTEVIEHRGWEAIESLRLKWTRALGETRWAHFSLQWSWLKYQAFQHIVRWEPCVLEVLWGSRSLGFLPLWHHRQTELWTSPNRLSGIGPATPVGRETTVIWIGVLRWLMDRDREGTVLDLGPFRSRQHVAGRLESACERTGARSWRRQITAPQRHSLASLPDASGQVALPESSFFASSDPRLDDSDSFDAILEDEFHRQDPATSAWLSPNPLPSNPLFRDATLAALAHDGLLHLTRADHSQSPPCTVLWLGDQQEVLPLATFTPPHSPPLCFAPHLQLLANHGFTGVEALGFDLGEVPKPTSKLQLYRIVSRFRWSDAWSSWWMRDLSGNALPTR